MGVTDTENRLRLVNAIRGLNAGYGEATRSHLIASTRALSDLASIISTAPSLDNGEGQYVRIGLFDHGSCLNQLAFGFAIQLGLGRIVQPPTAPRMPAPPPAHVVQSPASTEDSPLLYAVVANHPVDVQIQHTISFLARLVGRRVLTSGLSGDSIKNVDVIGSQIDAQADQEVADLIRLQGWRAAANAVKVRAEASRSPLVVHAASPLMTHDQITRQVPIARRIYNESPSVRGAIDRLATQFSQGMNSMGGTNAETAGFVRDFLDLGLSRTYTAHLVRDAYVCGNGYLLYGQVPDEDMRLLRPETVSIRDDGTYLETTASGTLVHRKVMHMTGATQDNSPYGISLLEPFVSLQLQREIAEHILACAAAWDTDEVPDEVRQSQRARVPLAKRTLAKCEQSTREILGPILGDNMLKIAVPKGLYLQGFTNMSPSAQALTTDWVMPSKPVS